MLGRSFVGYALNAGLRCGGMLYMVVGMKEELTERGKGGQMVAGRGMAEDR